MLLGHPLDPDVHDHALRLVSPLFDVAALCRAVPRLGSRKHPVPQRMVFRIHDHRARRDASAADQPPVLAEQARRALLMTSIVVAAIMLALPDSPLAGLVGLSAIPLGMLAAVAAVSGADTGVNEFVEAGIGLAV